MEQKPGNDAQALALTLQRLIGEGKHRAGALFFAREPLPGMRDSETGAEASTRVLYGVVMNHLDLPTAVDLLQLAKTLRIAADRIEADMQRAAASAPMRGQE